MTASPAWQPAASLSGDAAGSAAAVAEAEWGALDLLDPLDALLGGVEDGLDWGDDAALASALLDGFAEGGAAQDDAVPTPRPPLPRADDPRVALPCLDATHTFPCAMCSPAPAEGEEGAPNTSAAARPCLDCRVFARLRS